MKKTMVFIWGVVALLALAACNKGSYKRTKSGLMYKIISDKKNPVVVRGQIMKFHFVNRLRDSVLNSSEDSGPAYVPVDSIGAEYNAAEIFHLLRKGDSAIVIIEADTLRRKQGGLPPFLKSKDKIMLGLKVVDVFASQDAASKDQEAALQEMAKKMQAQAAIQVQKDAVEIEAYLKNKNITTQRAPRGTFVEIANVGDGPACDSGKFVHVKYTGQNMKGEIFDSNTNPQFARTYEPYVYQVGTRGAIDGWNDAMPLFRRGGKGRLYIPSALAYGKQGYPPQIAPNANLIFDVEIVNVTDTMPAPRQFVPPVQDTTSRR